MTHASHWRRSNGIVWLACIAFAALWDFLFWGHPLGMSAAIFTGVLCLAIIFRSPGLWQTGQGRIMAGLALLAVAALVEEPTSLGILITLLVLGTLVLVSQRDLDLLSDTVPAWLARTVALGVMLWTRVFRDNVIVGRWLIRHPRLGGRPMRLMTAIAWWVLPLMAGAVFAGLFALANPVMARCFSHLQDWLTEFFDWLLTLSFSRMFLWGIVIALTYGLLRHRHTWTTRLPAILTTPPRTTTDWLTGPQMIIRLLLVLNAVFAIENALDAAYLYAGVPLPKGLNYTQYAHRGAYTLIVTALLAGVFTLVAFRQNGTAHRSRACRWLVYAWIGQNILLLISTVRRVWLYVDMSDLTRLRFSTMIWCGLVAAGFVWIILRIKYAKPNAWLWRMNAFTAAAVLIICCFINFDGIIADFNVRHCAEAGGHADALDVAYLQHLGPPALPALAWIEEHERGMRAVKVIEIQDVSHALHTELNDEMLDWRGWTYRRQRVAAAVRSSPEIGAANRVTEAQP